MLQSLEPLILGKMCMLKLMKLYIDRPSWDFTVLMGCNLLSHLKTYSKHLFIKCYIKLDFGELRYLKIILSLFVIVKNKQTQK